MFRFVGQVYRGPWLASLTFFQPKDIYTVSISRHIIKTDMVNHRTVDEAYECSPKGKDAFHHVANNMRFGLDACAFTLDPWILDYLQQHLYTSLVSFQNWGF